MSDQEKSLSDEATYTGGAKRPPKEEQSLGDHSTLGGGDGSSVSDLGGIGDLADHDMEIVDLSKRYLIEKSLGKGGMGEVLLATDTRLDRQVAIKRIRGDVALGKTAAARFLTEAKAVASLSHNNVVGVYDYGRDPDGPFLIMEYVSGGSLLQRCKEGPIELEQAVDIACQLCEGLGRAHDAGIIHRDIKPANILLTNDGIPKLTDFGLAKADSRDHTMTMAGAVLGTLDFMPPEQRQDASLVDSRSDLWSLAASLYQMVTGKSPRIIRLIDVPPSLQEVLGKALEEEKKARYQTAIELRDALRESSDAFEPAIQNVTDLGAGECPNCHSRNDAGRKFCNGCGVPLRAPCLSCKAEIPVWEKFCGECGGNQRQLLDLRIEEIEKQIVEAEDLRSHYKYQAAIVIAEEISAIEDERFSTHRGWSEGFSESTKAEWKRKKESANQHVSEAKKHREAFDYDSAIHAIEAIPEAMRSPEVKDYLSTLEIDRDESLSLIHAIRDGIANRELDNLLPKVERALKLRGDREDLKKIRTQLLGHEAKRIRQRDEAFSKAKGLLDKGESKAAHKLIDNLRINQLTTEQEKFKSQIDQIILAETELSALVRKAKVDGVIDAEEAAQLIPVAANYLALNPHHEGVRELQSELLSGLGSVQLIKNSIGMELKRIPSGSFRMGKKTSFFGSAKPLHRVTLTKSFLLGVHQVTQGQYVRVMGKNPSNFIGDLNPVERVTWERANEFCQKLSALPDERASGRAYRLPTEAEWEYACRAGSTTGYSFGDDEYSLSEYAWYRDNSGNRTHPVGQKQPNAWGLFDMHGNVLEWCQDFYAPYRAGSRIDPMVSRSGSSYSRICRGGSFRLKASQCESASRHMRETFFLDAIGGCGFRVACVVSIQ